MVSPRVKSKPFWFLNYYSGFDGMVLQAKEEASGIAGVYWAFLVRIPPPLAKPVSRIFLPIQ
jgi:hypothetical protein